VTAPVPITVRSAEISTATVEIKTVTVNRKQMTLAMFRQLRDEPLISEDGKLNGSLWGSVNYHPDGCQAAHELDHRGSHRFLCSKDHGGHLHVIWQRGDELLKSVVHERDWCASHHYCLREYAGPIASGVIQGYFCAAGHRELPGWAQLTEADSWTRERSVIFSCDGVQCWAKVPAAPWSDRPEWSQVAYSGHDCAADLDTLGSRLRAETLQVKAEADSEDARRQQYTASWQAVSALPQLFIAL
jgi:hypothetical protein